MGRRIRDRTGQRYGRLVCVRPAESARYARWHCRCDCGGTAIVRGDFLSNGWTQSCGCLRRENAREQGAKAWSRTRIAPPAYHFDALASAMRGQM